MDEVFKAINDPSRRLLLDSLFEQDGQTLGELVTLLPSMTRHGVMNHLRILEGAALVTTRKQGRSKYHYLNPMPIRLVHDRWISRFAEPRLEAMAGIKRTIEGERMDKPSHVYTAYVAGSIADVWNAIIDPEATTRYFYGTKVESSWESGTPIRYLYPDGSVAADGEIISYEHEQRMEFTFLAKWDPELEAEGAVREAWSVEDANGVTKLTIEMFDVAQGSRTATDFSSGLAYIVSGLKTLVETGKSMA